MNNDAEKFATSMRGGYIIAQALHYGIAALNKVPLPYREVSNIRDMEYLRDTLFDFPAGLFDEVTLFDERRTQ